MRYLLLATLVGSCLTVLSYIPVAFAEDTVLKQMVGALQKLHPTEKIGLIGTPRHYALAKVYCGKYLRSSGHIETYAYEVKRDSPARFLPEPRATCERLAADPAESSYASLQGMLDAEIDTQTKKIEKMDNQLLDLMIQNVKARYTQESNQRASQYCLDEYQRYKNTMLLERETLGASGYRKNFNMFVLDRKRRTGDIKVPCGYWLAEQLGKKPDALEFAFAEFYSRHHLQPAEHENAEMLYLIFTTGRGGQKEPELAKFWKERADARRPPAAR